MIRDFLVFILFLILVFSSLSAQTNDISDNKKYYYDVGLNYGMVMLLW